MKVVILAGGYGSRLSEYTKTIPKPMVKVLGVPIIQRIIDYYISFGHYEFYIALGYKGQEIKKYFTKKKNLKKIKINLIETGKNTMTGGRLKRLKSFIGKETFLLTYGDAVTDLDINQVIKFHKEHGKMITVTAVRPPARFGELIIKENLVSDFKEKPQISEGWVNGGYFVCNPEVLDLIENDETVFEKGPLEELSKIGQLSAFKHYDFWQCMDTKRDRAILEDLWRNKKAKWASSWRNN